MANVKDFAVGLVLTPPSGTTGTTIVLRSGDGANFPTGNFYITASPPGQLAAPSNSEKLLCTSRSTDTLTVIRGVDGTSPKTMSADWIIVNAIYTSDLFNSSITTNEMPSGTPNGSLTTFTTSVPYSFVVVTKNGVVMSPGAGNDYTYNTSTGVITFAVAPATGSIIRVPVAIMGSQVMINGSNSFIAKESPIGAVNGSNNSYTVMKGAYMPGSLELYINGVRQSSTHFTETSPATGVFTTDVAPATGDNVDVSYQWTSGAFGNSDTVDGFHASTTPAANTLLPLNSNSKIDTSIISNPYRFRVAVSSAHAIGGSTKIQFNLKSGGRLYDTNNNFDTTNNRYNVPVTGVYRLSCKMPVQGMSSAGEANVVLYINGASYQRGQQSSNASSYITLLWSDDVPLVAGDYIEFYGALQFSGSLQSNGENINAPSWSGHLVSTG